MALFKKLLGSASSPFVDAVRSGDIASLQDENTKLDQVRDIEGRTLLHHAVETDSPDTLDLLISKGVEINQGDKDGWSPLHYAALFDRIECALIILASHGNIDVQTTSELWTPLHVAAWHGHIECARMLVEKGASVLIKDQLGRTPRDIAVSSQINEVVEMLDKRAEFGLDYAMKTIESSTASSLSVVFLDACMQGLSEQAEYLLDSGAVHSYRDASGVFPIHAAALNCEPHILTMLLDRGASITVQDDAGRTPLHWACQGGRKENMKILIEAGAEINPNFFPRPSSTNSSGSETSPISTSSHHKSVILTSSSNSEETSKVDRPKVLQQRQTLSELQHRTTVTESGALPASLLPPSANAIASPLHEACFSGSVECVEYLLERGADINSYCKGGGPLHFAAASKEDSGETLIALLKKGADPKLRNKLGQTALHIAAYYHNLDCVVRLLESNVCDVNAKDSNTATPIMRCIWGMIGKDDDKWAVGAESNVATESARGKAVLMTLIQRGGDPSIAETGGVTPLHVASYYGLSDVVKILVNNGANTRAVDDHNATCLHKAVLNNHVKVAEILLNVNVDKDATDDELMTPLHFAVYGVTGLLSNLDCVQLLISRGAKIDIPNIYLQTALHVASSRGETELALLLVNNGANPNAQDRQGNTPLHRALAAGHADTAFGLIGWGFAHAISQNPKISAHFIATENGFKEYPLHAAVLSKNINAVEGILGLGASGNSVVKIDVDVQECYGNTPLHAACALGSLELINSLLSNNASPHCTNIEGATPLHIATLNGFVDIVYTLIKSGVRVQDKDREGNTPLHYAAVTGDELTMAELVKGLQSGIIDQKNNYSQTALHIAASLGHANPVRILVESGATLLKDGSGLTAADLSIDYPEIVQYLKKSKATNYKQKTK